MPQDSSQRDDLPDALTADLARLYRVDAQPSLAVDQAILNRARAHVAGRKRVLLLRRVAGAAAAVILIAVALIPAIQRTRHPVHPVVAQHAYDVNADGALDIRDALALQQSINAGRPAVHDVNGDGIVDNRDVDAVAMLAVRLDKGATQ